MSAECYECGAPATVEADIYHSATHPEGDWWEALCSACAEYHVAAGNVTRPLS